MKTPSNELFQLIKSLSTQEKRFFKLYTQQNSESVTYIQLFDAIDLQNQYDEAKLLLLFKSLGKATRFKQYKNYLQEAIYRFLEYYHFDGSVDIQLQRLIQRIELLYSKRQFSSSKKFIVKAEKLAIDNHHFLYLLIIFSWKRKIMIRSQDFKAFEEYEQEQYKRELYYIELYKNSLEYEKINVKVVGLFIFKGTNLSRANRTELKKILQNPYMKREEKHLSFPEKVNYYRILGDVHWLLNEREKSYKYYKNAVSFFKQAVLPPNEQLFVYSRYRMALRELKLDKELTLVKDDGIKLIQSLPKKTQTNLLNNSYITIINNDIANQLSELFIEEALSLSNEIVEQVEKSASPQNFLVFYYNRFLLFFLKGDYRKALFCANKVFSTEKIGIRQDSIFLMKLLHLLLHYELGNLELLPHLCKSYHRDFKKQLMMNKIGTVIVNFFENIASESLTKGTKIKKLMVLKEELELFKKDEVMNQFDFISWVESKVENRPMIEILRMKQYLK